MRLFKIRYREMGGHVHCRVFVTIVDDRLRDRLQAEGHPDVTWAGIGNLVMSWQDWPEFRSHLKNVAVEPDDPGPGRS